MLEADLGAPRKRRHTARRIYDRLVAERGYSGSCSAVCRYVSAWRRGRRAAPGGFPGLGRAPGIAQVDFGNFRCGLAGVPTDMKLLVVPLPHSSAPTALVLGNATEAGRMVCGKVTESWLFSQFRVHYRYQTATATRTPATRRARWRTPWASRTATRSSRSRPSRP